MICNIKCNIVNNIIVLQLLLQYYYNIINIKTSYMNYKYLQYYEMNQFHYLFIIINSKIIIITTSTQYVHNLILCNNMIFNISY